LAVKAAARLASTSRQRIHDAIRRRRPRIEVEASRAAYIDRLYARSLAYDREEARWQAEQAAADAKWEAEMAALDGEEPAAPRAPYPPHQLGAVAAFLKLQARRGGDLSPQACAAAMDGSGGGTVTGAGTTSDGGAARSLRSARATAGHGTGSATTTDASTAPDASSTAPGGTTSIRAGATAVATTAIRLPPAAIRRAAAASASGAI
jgi:hypothetical protein